MKRAMVAAAAVAALLLGGCMYDLIGDSSARGIDLSSGALTFVSENGAGWVVVKTTLPGTIHWGESFDDSAYTKTVPAGTHAHYYGEEGCFGVRLFRNGDIVGSAIVPVEHAGGHVELVSADGMTVTVNQYGVEDEWYFITWGDGAETVISSREYYGFGGTRSHTYAEPGTYAVGIREAVGGDPYRECLQITVK